MFICIFKIGIASNVDFFDILGIFSFDAAVCPKVLWAYL